MELIITIKEVLAVQLGNAASTQQMPPVRTTTATLSHRAARPPAALYKWLEAVGRR